MLYADADERLSERLSRTPEGFVIARDAVLARTGQQEYHASELPTVQADADGWVVINRPEHEVFDAASLGSYVGKPIVLLHPDEEVHAGNVRELTIGTVLNARRGEGDDSDCVVGDLMFYDRHAIDLILRGSHRSLSAGYDASYTPRGAGIADQRGIRVNHLALLPNGEARCGDRCRVRDARSKETSMKRTRDQAGGYREGGAEVRADYRASFGSRGERTEGGLDPGGEVGPVVVAVLPGPATAYGILTDDQGRTVLVKHSNIEGAEDRGRRLTRPDTFVADARQRVAAEQERNRAWADSISAFWKKQAAHG
jgi:hypothetical protein